MPQPTELVQVALRCVFACPRTDQWPLADSLYHAVDAIAHGSDDREEPATGVPAQLVDEVDQLDALLIAAEKFAEAGVALPLSVFHVRPPASMADGRRARFP